MATKPYLGTTSVGHASVMQVYSQLNCLMWLIGAVFIVAVENVQLNRPPNFVAGLVMLDKYCAVLIL